MGYRFGIGLFAIEVLGLGQYFQVPRLCMDSAIKQYNIIYQRKGTRIDHEYVSIYR